VSDDFGYTQAHLLRRRNRVRKSRQIRTSTSVRQLQKNGGVNSIASQTTTEDGEGLSNRPRELGGEGWTSLNGGYFFVPPEGEESGKITHARRSILLVYKDCLNTP